MALCFTADLCCSSLSGLSVVPSSPGSAPGLVLSFVNGARVNLQHPAWKALGALAPWATYLARSLFTFVGGA